LKSELSVSMTTCERLRKSVQLQESKNETMEAIKEAEFREEMRQLRAEVRDLKKARQPMNQVEELTDAVRMYFNL